MDHSLSVEELGRIEEKMRQLSQEDLPIQQEMISREEALRFFEDSGEDFKIEILRQIALDQPISIYRQGTFTDLCRGPHVMRTGQVQHFKLTKVSGAYWRGDATKPMLQRIYGSCWPTAEELHDYLRRIEEARARDHRRLGTELGLFHMQDEAVGSVFWHPRGWTLFRTLVAYMRKAQDVAGYLEINTPDVMDRKLWEVSGHWENYRQHMFSSTTEDGMVQALKPMNCPGAVLLFKQGLRSFRQLPLRLSEFGKVHRYEPSGSLHGLLRVRHFTQDDAHIFCSRTQMLAECEAIIAFALKTYEAFGFSKVKIKLSTRPEKRMGTEADWDFLESSLASALETLGLAYEMQAGEGAFYGPKLEFSLNDAIGREWQCGTLQVDLNLPERFDLHYVSSDGTKERPVMLHRALFGSLERFIGILIEHHAGQLPAWLSPTQLMILTLADRHQSYASEILDLLRTWDVRVDVDFSSDTLSNKIRKYTLQKIPCLLIIGDREMDERTTTLRTRTGKMQKSLTREQLQVAIQEQFALSHST
jgi:threonyl-tRNA synthetase